MTISTGRSINRGIDLLFLVLVVYRYSGGVDILGLESLVSVPRVSVSGFQRFLSEMNNCLAPGGTSASMH